MDDEKDSKMRASLRGQDELVSFVRVNLGAKVGAFAWRERV